MQVAAVGRGAITRICVWRDGRPRPSKALGAAVISCLLLVAGSFIAKGPIHPVCVTSPRADFINPQRVTIRGYDGEAMEPFLTRDGKHLFFDNSNDPQANTNLHWAGRLDDLTFQYKGEIGAVNTGALEGVASTGRNSVFYFVSTRSDNQTASTIYRATFANGGISGAEHASGVSTSTPGVVDFDAEISADGNTLYFVESQFSLAGRPKTAKILIARRNGNSFHRDPGSTTILQQVNADALSYAPTTSSSELEILFTRLDSDGPAIHTASQRHHRSLVRSTEENSRHHRLCRSSDAFPRRGVALLSQERKWAVRSLPRNPIVSMFGYELSIGACTP